MKMIKNLNPNINSIEQYLNTIDKTEFDYLVDIANVDINDLPEQEFIDIMQLSLNIYCSELEADINVIIEDDNMVTTIIKRFVSTVLIYSLMSKGLFKKTNEDEEIFLYKDFLFERTSKGEMVAMALQSDR